MVLGTDPGIILRKEFWSWDELQEAKQSVEKVELASSEMWEVAQSYLHNL
jgi:hypothetical protein